MPPAKPPVIKVRVVGPDDVVAKPKRRPTKAEIGLRYDMSQFYFMKSVLESAFGHPVYLRLKETGTMKDWRAETIRLLDAIALAINSTVAVADQEWREDIADIIQLGRKGIKGSDTISDLFANLAATLTSIVFMQIGMMPSRARREKTVPLIPEFWTLNGHRSEQYVQTAAQLENIVRSRAQRQSSETL